MRKLKHFFWLLIFGIFATSCSEFDTANTSDTLFGLPHIAIEMRERDFNDLMRNSLVNEFKSANIIKNGERQTARMRRRGHFSRYFPKPSFSVIIGSDEFHLVSSNIDRSYLRAFFANEVFRAFGFLTPNMEFVSVSVNGVFLGLYVKREQIDELFFARRNIQINSLYEIRSGGRFSFENGLNSAMSFERHYPRGNINFSDLNILIHNLDQNNHRIDLLVDIENIALYSFISSAINNFDGITKNKFIFNCKSDNRFRIVPHDLDLTFGQTPLNGFVIPRQIPQFRNGLLERAEDVFIDFWRYGFANPQFSDINPRDELIRSALWQIEQKTWRLYDMKNQISLAYQNDIFLQGENLSEHLAKIRRFIREMVNL